LPARSANHKREEAMQQSPTRHRNRAALVLGAGLLTLSACAHTSSENTGAYAPPSAPYSGGLAPPDNAFSSTSGRRQDMAYSAPYSGGESAAPSAFAPPKEVSVSFAPGSATLDARSQRALDEIVSSLQQHSIDIATIVEDGGEQVGPNGDLDRERQRAVREYLRKRGVSEQVVHIQARDPNGG
jgi:outer membrane protein OmpA-like peptidoglycan-associated protein